MFSKNDVIRALSVHIGKEHGVSAEDLVKQINCNPFRRDKAGERRLRVLVTELRMEGYHICAHPSSGYFMARNEDELNETCEFLHSRSIAGLKQIAAMKRVSVPDLRGQLQLPT